MLAYHRVKSMCIMRFYRYHFTLEFSYTYIMLDAMNSLPIYSHFMVHKLYSSRLQI